MKTRLNTALIKKPQELVLWHVLLTHTHLKEHFRNCVFILFFKYIIKNQCLHLYIVENGHLYTYYIPIWTDFS